MTTKHMLEKDMLQPSMHGIQIIWVGFLQGQIINTPMKFGQKSPILYSGKGRKPDTNLQQKIQFLKAEMPERKEMKFDRQFR